MATSGNGGNGPGEKLAGNLDAAKEEADASSTRSDAVSQTSPQCCPKCHRYHPDGLKDGDRIPDETLLRRGVKKEHALTDGSIDNQSFNDKAMSCDIASSRTPSQTLAASKGLAGGTWVTFTAQQARDAFPGNEVRFRCTSNNPDAHCQVEGPKPADKRRAFAETTKGSLGK
jgi:hypothetical protein